MLVFHDLLGMYGGHTPKFVKRYADSASEMVGAVGAYAERSARAASPGPSTPTRSSADELEAFRRYLEPGEAHRLSLRRRLGGDQI